MITALIVVALCYIIPTMLMLLFFKYTKIGKEATDDAVFRDSFMPVMNIFYVFVMIAFLFGDAVARLALVGDILAQSTFASKFKSVVLKFVRGK